MPEQLGYEDILVREIDRQAERRAKAQAAEAGQAAGMEKLNDEREIREWLRDDETIDVDALLATGKSIEEITRAKHSNRVRLIESHSPNHTERCDFAEGLAKRVAAWQAQQGGEVGVEPALSELDAMGPVEMPATNGAGYE